MVRLVNRLIRHLGLRGGSLGAVGQLSQRGAIKCCPVLPGASRLRRRLLVADRRRHRMVGNRIWNEYGRAGRLIQQIRLGRRLLMVSLFGRHLLGIFTQRILVRKIGGWGCRR